MISSETDTNRVETLGTVCTFAVDYVIILNSDFLNNTAGSGSALYVAKPNESSEKGVIIHNCNFTGNTAINTYGAVYIYQAARAIITQSYFANNYAPAEGGAIHIETCSTLLMTECTFKGKIYSYNIVIYGT